MTFFRNLTVLSLALLAVPSLLGGCGDDDSGGSGGAAGSAGSAGSGGAGASGGAAGSGGAGGAGGSSGSAGSGGGAGLFNCDPATGSPPNLKLTEITTGLERPLIAVSPPADTERLIIGEQEGVLHVHKAGALVSTPYLDISDRVTRDSNEQGLLGLAFHPDYAQNGRFFVHYSADGTTAGSGDTVISEFSRMASNPDQADPASEKVLLTVDQPEGNHNGGSIEIRDGLLYIGLGDGGGAGDQHGSIGNGQALDTLLGKILRIDPDGTSAGKQYGIPAGNMTGSGVEPEIWSYGWRNPFRWTFDACTGDMYVGDVGQNVIEEIDVEPASASSGLNYGWREMEGSQCFDPPSGCDTNGKVMPVAEYDHGEGCSVAGGYVYRGSAIPGLRGHYLYGDFCSGKFWRFRWDGSQAADLTDITDDLNPTGIGNISSFGQDAQGELYVTTFEQGRVFRIEAE